jgi:outer membrane protein assembly factor BamA
MAVGCALAQTPAQTPKKSAKKSTTKAPAAKPAAVDPAKWPLVSIEVTGNRLHPKDRIVAASGLKLGAPVSSVEFDAARDRLVNSGAFLQVDLAYNPAKSGGGYAAQIAVTEVEQVYPLQFEEMPVPEAKVREAIRASQPLYVDKVPGSKEALATVVAAATNAVAELKPDYKEAITAEVTPETGVMGILIRPATIRPNIAQVTFEGSKAYSASDLQNAFSGVIIGTPYTDQKVRALLETGVRPMFEKLGYLRVSFPEVKATPSKRVTGMDLFVKVNDGPVFKFGETRVEGAGRRGSAMVQLANLKKDEVANFAEVGEAEKRIQSQFKRDGYLKVKTSMARTINDKDKTVDVVFTVKPGEQYTFGKMKIEGLDIVTEPAIRKMWGLKSGDPFNQEYPDTFLKAIKDQGVLDNLKETRSEIKVDEKSGVVDVVLYFK